MAPWSSRFACCARAAPDTRSSASSHQDRMQRSVKEHQAVCQSILDANGDAGRNEMLEHISIGGKDFAEFVSGLSPELLGI